MVQTDAEKAQKAAEEKGHLAKKKAEQERILAEMRADRDHFEARSSAAASSQQAAREAQPKLTIRLRYDLGGGSKGRRNLELEGTPATVSLFHLLQAIEDAFSVAPTRVVLRPADDTKRPIEPKDTPLPSFGSFASLEAFPSLEALGLRNGQEVFLTLIPEDAAELAEASVASAAQTTSPAAPSQPARQEPPPQQQQQRQPAPSGAGRPAGKAAAAKPPAADPTEYSEKRLKELWNKIEDSNLALARSRDSRTAAEVEKARLSLETVRLSGLLLWSREEVEFYARLKADLDRTVGLEPLKEFIVQRLRDAAGRHVLKEGKQPCRHVLISGAFGTGKRYAADFIGRLFSLLASRMTAAVRLNAKVHLAAWQDPENRGALITRNDVGVVTEVFPPGTAKPIRVQGPSGRFGNYKEEELIAEAEFLVTLGSLGDLVDKQTGKLRIPDRTCFYLRLSGPLSDADAAILDGVQEAGSIVVMACTPEVAEANMQLSAFRRRQPEVLLLPTLTANDVARQIAAAVEKKGYYGVGEGDVGTPQLVTVLEHIVRQRFDDALIREKNSHLAKDVLDLAISRKNDRTWQESLDSEERFRLTPLDFGLDVLTEEQRERRLQEVAAEVEDLVGWGGADEAGSARHFFVTLTRQRAAGGAPGVALQLPRALWVMANPGSGRETFVQLAARFLRASGAISRDEVIWIDGRDLADKGADDELTSKLGAANRGCLAIKDADALADSREAVRALLNALESAEGSSTLIIVIGTPSGMARIGRMEPSLESRFPTRVGIPDFTAEELVTVIEQVGAANPSGALYLEDGLAPRLVDHINEAFGGGPQGKELGERGNLTLARQLLQKAVQNRITRLFNRIQGGEQPGDSPETERLTSGDFEVGAPLGEGTEQKAAIDEEVGNLVGMDKAKEWFKQVRQKVAFVEQTGTRSDLRVCLNIIITGNPGTGKTTFARLLAKFFYTYGVLTKDSFVEKNGLELKAEYMGGTAPRVKAAVQEAMGGCLFLDEAYALMDSSQGVGGSGDAFSQEALRTLLTEVENNRTNLMVVLAGYKDKMGRLMRAEEGLRRRFPNALDLDDYTPRELAQICEMTARSKHQREFETGLREKLATHIENFYWRDIAQQNAGLSVNLTEQALDRQIVRIVSKHPGAFAINTTSGAAGSGHPGQPVLLRQRSGGHSGSIVSIQQVKQEAATFTAADFGIEERPTLGDPELRAKVQEEVNRLTGMENVKGFFQELARTVTFVERGGDPKVLQTSLNLQLTGNPGTGKTTVARLIARYLYAHGVLPRDNFVERNALVLKGQFVGQTAPTVQEAVRDAMGGCLFIDEAYALVDRGGDKFSGEVVRTLLTEVENHRTGLLVVLAGYKDKMETLMDADPGLRRRFALTLQLQDYSPQDLAAICETAAADRFKLTFAPGLRDDLAKHIELHHGQEIQQHNGGLAVTLAERAFRKLAMRLGEGEAAVVGPGAKQLTAADFGIGDPVKVSSPAPVADASAAHAMEQAGGTRRSGEQHGERPPAKRGKPEAQEWREAVGSLARDFAAELLLAIGEEAAKPPPPPPP
eukprot:TRINITY_DN29823_c0_g1_i1.p1 TRINITY_DN29823_c0_g1~~TRINITY_DN29823_c0_g1_i1.p1  ORF type:complete len:1556 (+),score=419.81 TRINITY_DN29823_c0_g1_i1:134-4801(+)